jgi:DNA-binding PadR family transcriptional regulator
MHAHAFGGPGRWRGCGPSAEDATEESSDYGRHFGRGFERGFRDFRRGGPRMGGRERLFDAGDIRLVVLKLLAEQPSYGYQLMKTMEQRLAGGYTPSAGVIYPTLTLLEEEGLASVTTSDANKKVYSVTPEGLEYLAGNQARVEELFERLEETGRGFRHGRSPEIIRAMENLRGAIMARVFRGNATPEQIRKIAEAVNAAAKAIDEL